MRRSALPILLVLAASAVLALVSGFRPLWILSYALALSLALGYGWARFQTAGLSIQPNADTPYPTAGDPLRLRLGVRERWPFPRWGLRIQLSRKSGEQAAFPLPSSQELVCDVGIVERGPNIVLPLKVQASDPLGLADTERTVTDAISILGYPAALSLSATQVEQLGAALRDSREGRSSTQRRSGNTLSSSVREYAPGDSLMHVHWMSTARRGELMTREFDRGSGGETVWIFVDMYKRSQIGTGILSSEEQSLSIAASLATAFLQNATRVGLVMHGNQAFYLLPNRGEPQQKEILHALAVVKAHGEMSLEEVIALHGTSLGPTTIAVVVGPATEINDRDTITEQCRQKGSSVLPVLFNPTHGQRESPQSGPLSDETAYRMQRASVSRHVEDALYYWTQTSDSVK